MLKHLSYQTLKESGYDGLEWYHLSRVGKLTKL